MMADTRYKLQLLTFRKMHSVKKAQRFGYGIMNYRKHFQVILQRSFKIPRQPWTFIQKTIGIKELFSRKSIRISADEMYI